jgi:hypothetical protein
VGIYMAKMRYSPHSQDRYTSPLLRINWATSLTPSGTPASTQVTMLTRAHKTDFSKKDTLERLQWAVYPHTHPNLGSTGGYPTHRPPTRRGSSGSVPAMSITVSPRLDSHSPFVVDSDIILVGIISLVWGGGGGGGGKFLGA